MMRIANGLQTFALRLRFFFWSLFFVFGIVFHPNGHRNFP
jgi:hypothetical protein